MSQLQETSSAELPQVTIAEPSKEAPDFEIAEQTTLTLTPAQVKALYMLTRDRVASYDKYSDKAVPPSYGYDEAKEIRDMLLQETGAKDGDQLLGTFTITVKP